jgi:HAD superfamily hydrolase (TIGR01549 family)
MRAIIFDLDGTLIDSHEDILAAFSKAFEGLGVPMPSEERLISVIGRRLEDCFARFLDGDMALGDEGARLFRAWYKTHYRDATRPYPGADEALRRLAEKVPLAVCTMKKGIYAREIVRSFGWEPLFKTVVGSEEGLPPKPDPAMLLEACRLIGSAPAESLYVGDTPLDARMALRAGVPFAFAAYGYGSLDGEADLPTPRVIRAPADLGALATTGSPSPKRSPSV